MNENGVVIRNRARLVARGYRQEEGIDYDKTCAPIARLEAIRIFLAYVAYMDFMVYQMNVKNVFLNGKITEEVYVQQPPGFESSEFPNYVENYEALPLKETVNAALATLGLVEEKNPQATPSELINSSTLRIRYFSLMMYIVKCLGGMQGSQDQLNTNHQVIAYSLIWGMDVDIGNILFFDLIAKLVNDKKDRDVNICYTREVNANSAIDNSLYGTAVQSTSQPKQKLTRSQGRRKSHLYLNQRLQHMPVMRDLASHGYEVHNKSK
ncbi:retrovirus-related pol polyprotein from transposon TNT 1-94 [Tanacetum coccineum]